MKSSVFSFPATLTLTTSKLPYQTSRRLRHLPSRRRKTLYRHLSELGSVTIHIEPRAVEDELNVMRKVENGSDEREADEEEEDRICCTTIRTRNPSNHNLQDNIQKINFSIGVKM